MMKLQMANMPLFPSTFRNNCPMGKDKSVDNISATEVVANEAAIKVNQPSDAVAATPTRIAIGAALAAPETSSAI